MSDMEAAEANVRQHLAGLAEAKAKLREARAQLREARAQKAKEHREQAQREREKVRAEIEMDYLDIPEKVRNHIWDRAYDQGHSSGWHEVRYWYEELADLARLAIDETRS